MMRFGKESVLCTQSIMTRIMTVHCVHTVGQYYEEALVIVSCYKSEKCHCFGEWNASTVLRYVLYSKIRADFVTVDWLF